LIAAPRLCLCRYERKPPCSFKNIVDTQIISAMGPPGGGRNPVFARVLRHFNILSFTELSDDSVGRIFTTILGAFLQRNFGADVGDLTDKVSYPFRTAMHSAACCLTRDALLPPIVTWAAG
jgi:hypothetical protein